MLYNVTANEVSAMRSHVISALQERQGWENMHCSIAKDLESKTRYLSRMTKEASLLDAFSLGYLHTHPRDFSAIFLSHRRVSQCFNIYGIPKAFAAARALNGGVLLAKDGDEATLACAIEALHTGESNGKLLQNLLNQRMHVRQGHNKYNSGGTQFSASMRVLEAFGIVQHVGSDRGCKAWGVRDSAMFQRLYDATQGIYGTPADMIAPPANDVLEAPEMPSIIDAECDMPLVFAGIALDDDTLAALASDIASDDGMPIPDDMSALEAPVSDVPAIVLTAKRKRSSKRAVKKAVLAE